MIDLKRAILPGLKPSLTSGIGLAHASKRITMSSRPLLVGIVTTQFTSLFCANGSARN